MPAASQRRERSAQPTSDHRGQLNQRAAGQPYQRPANEATTGQRCRRPANDASGRLRLARDRCEAGETAKRLARSTSNQTIKCIKTGPWAGGESVVEVNVGKPRSPDQISASPHATRYHTRPYRDPRRPRKTVKSPSRVSRRLGGSVLVEALSGHYQYTQLRPRPRPHHHDTMVMEMMMVMMMTMTMTMEMTTTMTMIMKMTITT